MMKKMVVPEDVNIIVELLKNEFQLEEYQNITRMGGLTNRTYLVLGGDGIYYVCRIPGEGTEEMINRYNEKVSTELACSLGIDAELLYFGEDGTKISKYIENAVTMNAANLKKNETIIKAAEIFKTLHTSGVDTGVPFEVFDMAKEYEEIIAQNKVELYNDYTLIKEKVMKIKEEIDEAMDIKKVPCHNDSLCENWVEGNGKLYLIDWEYAGMNDGMWDLADLSIEAEYSDDEDDLLLRLYLGREVFLQDRKHFMANKIYLDYLWTLWGKTRVPYDGEEMEAYALMRYNRLKQNIEIYMKTMY